MKSSFQTILIGSFILIFIVALFMFANLSKRGGSTVVEPQGNVVLWGTLDKEKIESFLTTINNSHPEYSVSYVQVGEISFIDSFIRALANDAPPDLLLVDSNTYNQVRDKLYTIPFESISLRQYQTSYIDGANIFVENDGIKTLPVAVDPMVLYYNRDLLAGQGYVVPPTTWTGLVQSIPRFLRRDARGVITQNVLALGETANIPHFKEILSTLFLQTGISITTKDANGRIVPQIALPAKVPGNPTPAEEVLRFYTSFANSTDTHYNWNKSLPSSADMFLSGASAFYIGKASELFTLRQRNPNLNFDVTSMIQTDGATRPVTYGNYYGLAVVNNSPNILTAYTVMNELATDAFGQYLAQTFTLAPVKRSLLLQNQPDPYVSVFYESALGAFSWIDPDPRETTSLFAEVIRGIHSGEFGIGTAVGQLQLGFNRIGN